MRRFWSPPCRLRFSPFLVAKSRPESTSVCIAANGRFWVTSAGCGRVDLSQSDASICITHLEVGLVKQHSSRRGQSTSVKSRPDTTEIEQPATSQRNSMEDNKQCTKAAYCCSFCGHPKACAKYRKGDKHCCPEDVSDWLTKGRPSTNYRFVIGLTYV
jgi:hypothetical protein